MNIRQKILGMVTASAVALSAAGCTTTQVTNFLAQVQADTAQACKFVPTIATILAVAQSLGFAPAAIAGAVVATVAGKICSQVPPPTSARYQALAPVNGGAARTVAVDNGVRINGWRTQ